MVKISYTTLILARVVLLVCKQPRVPQHEPLAFKEVTKNLKLEGKPLNWTASRSCLSGGMLQCFEVQTSAYLSNFM